MVAMPAETGQRAGNGEYSLRELADLVSSTVSGGGGGVRDDLGERVTKIEAGFEAMRSDIAMMRAEGRTSFRWIIGTVLGVAIAILTVINAQIKTQGEHFQDIINANQKASEARLDEFRRDSDRNYYLALKALERSIATEAKEKPAE